MKFYLRLRKAVLEQSGYQVIGASTIKDAMKAFRKQPICLVISDHVGGAKRAPFWRRR